MIKSFGKGIATAGVAIAAVTIAMKKLFDVASEGAAIQQQAESFDLLMQKAGGATDIMDRLREASRNTISDFELQSSTATLLAGAQGELATALANSTPELLNIAKAANKLNPALGSTTFLYESLSRGIKRASPLILDNLGLVIKVGDANEAMAEQLGKTVSELTANEKAQAILNDTLRAGQVLLDQVGGDTISATDAYEKMNTAIKNSTDEGKKWLGEFLAPAADSIALLLTHTQQLTDILADHETQMLDTAATYEEYVTEMVRAAIVADKLTKVEGDLILQELALGKGLHNTNAELRLGNAVVGKLGDNMDRAGIKTENLFDIVRDGTEVIDGHIEAQIRAEAAADNVSAAQENQAQVTALLNEQLRDLQILIGADLVASQDKMIEKTAELEAEALSLQEQMDELGGSLEAAGETGAEEFGALQTKLEDTRGEIAAVAAAWDEQTKAFILNLLIQRAALDGLTTDEFTLITDVAEDFGLIDLSAKAALQGVDRALTALAEGEGMAAARSEINAVLTTIQKIEGDHYATIYIETIRTSGGGESEFQHGGQLPGSGVALVGEQGPELIVNGTVIPARLTAQLLSLGMVPNERNFLVAGAGGLGFDSDTQSQISMTDSTSRRIAEDTRQAEREEEHSKAVSRRVADQERRSGGGGGQGLLAVSASVRATAESSAETAGAAIGQQLAATVATATVQAAQQITTATREQSFISRETNQILIEMRDLLEEQPTNIGQEMVAGLDTFS